MNRRPQRPERCALAKLRYTPNRGIGYHENGGRSMAGVTLWRSVMVKALIVTVIVTAPLPLAFAFPLPP